MPSSLQARRTRKAISPRLAIRILSNIASDRVARVRSLKDDQWLTVLDRLAVFEKDLRDGPRSWSWNLIHGFHGFDNQQGIAGVDLAADIDKGTRARLGCPIRRTHHWRSDGARVLGGIKRGGGQRCRYRRRRIWWWRRWYRRR